MPAPKLTIAVIAGGVVLATALIIAFRASKDGSTADGIAAPPSAAYTFDAKPFEQFERADVTDAVLASMKSNKRLTDLPMGERDAIASSAAELFQMYQGGTFSDFQAWIAKHNLPPSRWITHDPDVAASEWARSQGLYGDMEIDVDRITAILKVRGGKPVQDAQNRDRSVLYYRNFPGKQAAVDGDVELQGYDGDIIEVLVPAILKDKQGQSFQGRLSVLFARRASDGKWVPVGAGGYDFPSGRPSPPLRI